MSLLLAALLAVGASAGSLEGDAARAGGLPGGSSAGAPEIGDGVELPARAAPMEPAPPAPPEITRAGVLEALPRLEPRPIPQGASLGTRNGAAPGELTHYDTLAAGRYAGSSGAGPGIGLVLRVPGGQAWAGRFSAGDDAGVLLSRARPPGGFPAGTRAALFGGDGSPDSDRILGAVVRFLMENRERVGIDGYAAQDSLYVDGRGRYFGLRRRRGARP